MIKQLAKMLGLSPEQAEASMHSERAARAVLTRRNLFAAGAALAVGSSFSFAPVRVFTYYNWAEIEISIGGFTSPGLAVIKPIGTVLRTWQEPA